MLGRSKPNFPGKRDIGGDSLQPLLVDYFTRDGSTLTMRLLASSPQIAVGGRYPYEHKYFAYLLRWSRLIEKTEWPRKVWNEGGLASLSQEKQMPLMGAPPWNERELLDPAEGDERFSEYAFRVLWEEFSHRATAQTRSPARAAGRRRPLLRGEAPQHVAGGPERSPAVEGDRRPAGPARHLRVDRLLRAEAGARRPEALDGTAAGGVARRVAQAASGSPAGPHAVASQGHRFRGHAGRPVREPRLEPGRGGAAAGGDPRRRAGPRRGRGRREDAGDARQRGDARGVGRPVAPGDGPRRS